MADGKLRWDCNVDGCFKRLKSPKWEAFTSCFSRGSAFGDIDAVIDNNGKRFLFVDWKPHGKKDIDTGQRRLYKALSSLPGVTIILINGYAETTTDVSGLRVISAGQIGVWEAIDFPALQARLASWWRSGLPEIERRDYDLKHRQPGDNLQPLGAGIRGCP